MKKIQKKAKEVFEAFKKYVNDNNIPSDGRHEVGDYVLNIHEPFGLYSVVLKTPREIYNVPHQAMWETEITTWGNSLIIPIELTKEELFSIYDEALKFLNEK